MYKVIFVTSDRIITVSVTKALSKELWGLIPSNIKFKAQFEEARLKIRREEAGLTQAKLSILSGVKISAIGLHESGRRGLSYIHATKLAKVLKCKVKNLR